MNSVVGLPVTDLKPLPTASHVSSSPDAWAGPATTRCSHSFQDYSRLPVARVGRLDPAASQQELEISFKEAAGRGDVGTLNFFTDVRHRPFVALDDLYEAVEQRQSAMVRVLLELAKDEAASIVNARVPGKGLSAFRKAALVGDEAIFAALLAAGGDLESRVESEGMTVARLAAENPQLQRHVDARQESILSAV